VSAKECRHQTGSTENCACGRPAIVLARAVRMGVVAIPPAPTNRAKE
jgi:hypothetical protein